MERMLFAFVKPRKLCVNRVTLNQRLWSQLAHANRGNHIKSPDNKNVSLLANPRIDWDVSPNIFSDFILVLAIPRFGEI